MIKRLKLTLLLCILSPGLFGATDCVDCGNHIEGFPSIASLEQASCTDCKCYTETHADTIQGLISERAQATKEKLKENINNANQGLAKKLASFNKFFQSTAGFDQSQVAGQLNGCGLEQVKAAIGDCPSSKNKDHLNQVFGVDSIDEYLASMAKAFTDEDQLVNNSCLKKSDINDLNSSRHLLSELKALLPLINKHKQSLLLKIGDNTNLLNLDTGENEDLIMIKDRMVELSLLDMTLPVFLNSEAFKKLIADSDKFLSNPGQLLSFFKKDVYDQFPKTKEIAVQKAREVCDDFIVNISKVACSGDDLAFVNSSKLYNGFNYFPADHQNGFDSLFADDTGLEIIESNYVSHLYWCASTSCQRAEVSLPLCSQVQAAQSLTPKVDRILAEDHLNKRIETSIPNFDPNSLCKLAECQGTEAQMNSCYEGVKEELGEDADAILLSYSKIPNSSNQTNQPGANYTPTQTPFAQQFLGSYASRPAVVATPASTQTTTSSAIPNDPSVIGSNQAITTSPSGASTSSSSGNRVVTANDAFQEFMNQRFNSLGSSASSYPRTQIQSNNAVSTGIRVSSNESMSPSERRALDSMNRASETIEELRESYRNSALDRMQDLVEQAAASRNVVGTNPSSGRGFTSLGGSAQTARSNSNIQNPAQTQNNIAAPIRNQGNVSDNEVVGPVNTNSPQATNADRSIASVPGSTANSSETTPRIQTNNQGLQVLNVQFSELPTISSATVQEEGVDTTKTFNIAVRLEQEVFLVEVRPTFVAGRRILEPLLDNLSAGLKAEVLKSPLFNDYRQYLLGNLVNN